MRRRVMFENDAGAILRPYEMYGIALVSWSAPAPAPKLYKVSLEGMDGELDMSEWTGSIRYEKRKVTISMVGRNSEGVREIVQFLHGRRAKITFSDEPQWYYDGRCESLEVSTATRGVAEIKMIFSCDPYRMAHIPECRVYTASATPVTDTLYTSRRPAVSTVAVETSAQITFNGATYNLTSGTHTLPTFIIDDTPRVVSIMGSGTITLTWQDGVL